MSGIAGQIMRPRDPLAPNSGSSNSAADTRRERGIGAGFGGDPDLDACRGLLANGSRSFLAASRLLPADMRDAATALYAFCRVTDDVIDQPNRPADTLQQLERRLDHIYAGQPLPDPVDRAFARVVARHAIPRALPDGLIEGFAWDADGRSYETLSEVHAYAARVAGTVGAMMALLMGVRDPEVQARACDLGVAMQLTNIARDVGEDARNGRLYLPRTWLREAGIDPDAWLAAPVFSPALGAVIERLLKVADCLYARADVGLRALPAGCRRGIRAARLLYAEIGHELRRRGLDSVSQRAVVSGPRKLGRLIAGTGQDWLQRWTPCLQAGETLPEVRFIIDAVEQTPARPAPLASSLGLGDRVAFVVDLFGRLQNLQQEREHARLAGAARGASAMSVVASPAARPEHPHG